MDPLYYKLCLSSFLDTNLEDVLCGLFIIYSPSVLCYIFPLPVPSLELGEVHTWHIQQVISVVLDPSDRRVPLSQPVLHCLHHSHHFAQLRGTGPGGSRPWSRVRYLPLSAVSLSRATFLDLLSSSSTPRRWSSKLWPEDSYCLTTATWGAPGTGWTCPSSSPAFSPPSSATSQDWEPSECWELSRLSPSCRVSHRTPLLAYLRTY